MKHFVLDENNNKVEAYSKEEVLAVLQQAINDGTLQNIVKDAGFINKIKCCVTGDTSKIAYVTQAKYNELEANNLLEENTEYNIVDDTTCDDINTALEELNTAINNVNANAETKLPVYDYSQDNDYTAAQNIIYYVMKNIKGNCNGITHTFILRFIKSGTNNNYLVSAYSPASVVTIIKAFKLLATTTDTEVIYSQISYSGDISTFTIDQITSDMYTVDTIRAKTSFSDDFIGTTTTSGEVTLTETGAYLLNINYRLGVASYTYRETTAILYWSGNRTAVWHHTNSLEGINLFISESGVLTWNCSSESTLVESVSYKKLN